MCTKFALGVKVGGRRTTRLRLQADACRARARVSAQDKGRGSSCLNPYILIYLIRIYLERIYLNRKTLLFIAFLAACQHMVRVPACVRVCACV